MKTINGKATVSQFKSFYGVGVELSEPLHEGRLPDAGLRADFAGVSPTLLVHQ